MTIASMTFRLLISISVATTLFQPLTGFADSAQSEKQNAQAVQFGIFFGGAASQFDQCVQRGLVTAGPRPAGEQASSFMRASIQSTRDTDGFDGSDAVHKGWDIAKQKIHEQNPKYWEDNCDAIGKQWNKYVSMYKLQ